MRGEVGLDFQEKPGSGPARRLQQRARPAGMHPLRGRGHLWVRVEVVQEVVVEIIAEDDGGGGGGGDR